MALSDISWDSEKDSSWEDYSFDESDEYYKTDEDDDDCHERKNFIILKDEDIHQRINDDIQQISTLLSVSKEEAIILLSHSHWNVNSVSEDWFADEDKVRKFSGLFHNLQLQEPLLDQKEFFCGICLENYLEENDEIPCSAACGHVFCKTCWKTYVNLSIIDGGGCLTLKCPQPSCNAAISQDMIGSLASEDNKKKYENYLIQSYVEVRRKNIKWCPAPGCNFAVEFLDGSSVNRFDVICECSHRFCWNCYGEAHSPVDCDTVIKWNVKNNSEEENTNWLLSNSKPCPKCKRPIEKNQGCMHMTCIPLCDYEFCWLCLGAWSEHSESTGGFYACNSFDKAKKDGTYDEAENRRKKAKNSLDKYTHYYERWASNDSSMKRALLDMKESKNDHLKKLVQIQGESEDGLQFIIDAWIQIVECRRVLKWSYVYGYYLLEKENAKKDFFEYVQGDANGALERLHHCAEKDIFKYLQAKYSSEDFNDFRSKLVNLTGVTRNYFDNMVRALENGLSDVESQTIFCKTRSSEKKSVAA